VVKVLRGGQLGDVVRLRSKTFSQRRISLMRRRVDAFVTISHEIDAELENLGISRSQRVFIPNGVEIERFQPISSPEKLALRLKLSLPAGPLVIYTGRFVHEKRLDLLLKAWGQLQSGYPDATLLLVGDGEESAGLKASAGPGVVFPGQMEDVLPYLQAADIFVLPSATEGLSNALLEAMAVGLPVVATSVGGAPDLIKDGENGWLIPADDVGALSSAINTLLIEENLRRSLGESARQIIIEQYALRVVADRLRSLYDSILSPGRSTERVTGPETNIRLDEKFQS
jgi:glycosyltransferase involved in cell wall biosynthesis